MMRTPCCFSSPSSSALQSPPTSNSATLSCSSPATENLTAPSSILLGHPASSLHPLRLLRRYSGRRKPLSLQPPPPPISRCSGTSPLLRYFVRSSETAQPPLSSLHTPQVWSGPVFEDAHPYLNSHLPEKTSSSRNRGLSSLTMAESICRALRDGALEGEHAPALSISDSIDAPFSIHVFDHVLSQLNSFILAGKSQSRGLVLVAFCRSPSFYIELLNREGIHESSTDEWIRILDCYSDPLGWKYKLMQSRVIRNRPSKVSPATSCRDVRNLNNILSGIIELGTGLVGQGKGQFSVAIDSVSEMLRHASLSSVARLLSGLRSHQQVSSLFWSLHSDLHDAKETSAIEYMSSIVAVVEGSSQSGDGQRGSPDTQKAKFHVRSKRRNGRVKLMSEEIHVEHSHITFAPLSCEDESVVRTLLPKVQFNLRLSEKEQADRSKVVLPFEHQEDHKAKQIYDGRQPPHGTEDDRAISEVDKLLPSENAGRGEILYVRDSDDEMPDSDEDPDDDLDI